MFCFQVLALFLIILMIQQPRFYSNKLSINDTNLIDTNLQSKIQQIKHLSVTSSNGFEQSKQNSSYDSQRIDHMVADDRLDLQPEEEPVLQSFQSKSKIKK
jgi:hypothetical protein